MSDNIRIKTKPGTVDNIKVKINQKFDFIEILSLKISQDEAYRRFCSDYGVVVGRVIINNGVGVPNAKVSIFIPIEDEDKLDPEIFGLYPYEIITDLNSDGIKYNLLSKDNNTNDDCFTPIGTFPSKREIQDNPVVDEIYCKYYKFTATSNDSGDFMLFGVPVGNHIIHVDVDISDIGILSQKPWHVLEEGASKENFASPTKFKGRGDSTTITQLKTIESSINVIPFWGDTEECEVGITRSDVFVLQSTITPSALFIGSIISDNDKHSINRRCRPRKKMGKAKELITGAGTIEMIRKAKNGRIERHDVQGGQVIGEDGTWSYLIPMNLDHKVTSEEGEMVDSDDPSKGIATRTNVRFRIGMNITGDEGKLRTSGKYLVPNNPTSNNLVDYDFGTGTKPESFVDLKWNKIYSIKNYIARLQPNRADENRNFIGIKDVDEGPNTPFPFNRLDNDTNPLFSYLCFILNVFLLLVCLLNSTIILAVNLVIYILNIILGALCSIIAGVTVLVCALKHLTSSTNRKNCRCDNCLNKKDCTNGNCFAACFAGIIPYLPYMTLPCSADKDGLKYAPCGWYSENIPPLKQTTLATENVQNSDGMTEPDSGSVDPVTGDFTAPPPGNVSYHYPGDGHGGHNSPGAGWVECQITALAAALNIFEFDFYNDWVNGTLYAYLIKVKIKKRGEGEMKFCDTDCEDDELGTDFDDDGEADNNCRKNYILDTCTNCNPTPGNEMNWLLNPDGVNAKTYKQIKEGYIKRYDNEFYYSAVSKKSANRLYATDIINLGSMVDNDWEGTPKFHNYLIDTTFNKPPLIAEYDGDVVPSNPGSVDVSGFDTKIGGGNSDRLIANIYCLPVPPLPYLPIAGFLTDEINCINIRRLSELGVGLDEDRYSDGLGYVDNRITNNDVENPFVRGLFAWVNDDTPAATIPLIYFDAQNPAYLAPATGNMGMDNQGDYQKFRGRELVNQIKEHDQSFYFYFGLIPGRSALNNMNRKFFTECIPESKADFFIIGEVLAGDDEGPAATGELQVTFLNGLGPFTINWYGPTINGDPYEETYTDYDSNSQTVGNLYVGSYTIIVTDALGRTSSAVFYVDGPLPTQCNIQSTNLSKNSSYNESDGKISVNVTGGQTPYIIEVFEADPSTGVLSTSPFAIGSTVYSASTILNSHVFQKVNGIGGLPLGTYSVVVKDSGTPQTQCSDLVEIEEPSELNVVLKAKNVTCFEQNNGQLSVSGNTGGDPPYSYQWSATAPATLAGQITTGDTISNLAIGTYEVDVIDGNGQSDNESYSITQPANLIYSVTKSNAQCNSGLGKLKINSVSSNVEGQINSDPYVDVSSGHIFNNLSTGVYNLTLRNKTTQCTKQTGGLIDQPSTEFRIVNYGNNTVFQSTSSHGQVFIRVTGGWGNEPSVTSPAHPYRYKWRYHRINSGWGSVGNQQYTTYAAGIGYATFNIGATDYEENTGDSISYENDWVTHVAIQVLSVDDANLTTSSAAPGSWWAEPDCKVYTGTFAVSYGNGN